MTLDDLVHPSVRDGSVRGRFSPKLDPNDRLKALALLKLGYPVSVIAKMYSIHSRTCSQIARDSSKHYKHGRRIYAELGHEEFIRRHLIEDDIRNANQAVSASMREAPVNGPVPDTQATVAQQARRGSDSMAGTHLIVGHKVTVYWDESVSGWFYMDELAGDSLGPYPNSKKAYDQAKIDMELMA